MHHLYDHPRVWRCGLLALTLASASLTASRLHAQSADALIDKLVEKGVLSVDEANNLREEADKNFTTSHAVKTGMPDWVTSMRFNGDFRGRYEGFFSDNPAFVDRNRFRYRARIGWTAVLKDDFEIGIRLATGDDSGNAVDPISTNQTLQNNGSKKPINLDLAYFKWTPVNEKTWSASFSGGKIENPFVFSDAVFDADYTPEGLAQNFTYSLSDTQTLKANFGEFVLDELGSSSNDPYLVAGQLRLDSVWSKEISTSVGVSYLSILGDQSLTSANVPDVNRGNLRNINSSKATLDTVNGFDTLVGDASVTYTFESGPMYTGAFPVKLFGELLHNGAAQAANDGWQAGVTFGKAGKKGTWELTYRYKYLQGDVWYEELADSDFGAFYQDLPGTIPAGYQGRTGGRGYGSGTNVRGHIVKAGYSPYDSLTFNITAFVTELIEAAPVGSNSAMLRLQADAIWKF